jgi:hypothetical protein
LLLLLLLLLPPNMSYVHQLQGVQLEQLLLTTSQSECETCRDKHTQLTCVMP